MTTSITLRRPDDWHLHLRDGSALMRTVPDVCGLFARAIIMPNLATPVINTQAALSYRERILQACPKGSEFNPLMTLYLSPRTTVDDIHEACDSKLIYGVKLYPAGATTNSANGVSDLSPLSAVLEAMQERGLVLQIHGEVTDPQVDIFDREQVFIESVLKPLLEQFPSLKVVLEHITTAQAVDFVQQGPSQLAATITAHHLLINRNAMFAGGIRPHAYCLPVAKRETHRQALLSAVASGSDKFFLGTDSAPHSRSAKEAACGCAGIYTAPFALALYAEAFDSINALDHFEGFASVHGPAFYGLEPNHDSITLIKKPQPVPDNLAFEDSQLVPFRAGETLPWSQA